MDAIGINHCNVAYRNRRGYVYALHFIYKGIKQKALVSENGTVTDKYLWLYTILYQGCLYLLASGKVLNCTSTSSCCDLCCFLLLHQCTVDVSRCIVVVSLFSLFSVRPTLLFWEMAGAVVQAVAVVVLGAPIDFKTGKICRPTRLDCFLRTFQVE